MALPEMGVLDWLKTFRFSFPRIHFRSSSFTVKLEANIEAVTLWQSEQLQTNVETTFEGTCGSKDIRTDQMSYGYMERENDGWSVLNEGTQQKQGQLDLRMTVVRRHKNTLLWLHFLWRRHLQLSQPEGSRI